MNSKRKEAMKKSIKISEKKFNVSEDLMKQNINLMI